MTASFSKHSPTVLQPAAWVRSDAFSVVDYWLPWFSICEPRGPSYPEEGFFFAIDGVSAGIMVDYDTTWAACEAI